MAFAVNPEVYARRRREAAEEMEKWSKALPIFLYTSAVLPGDVLSLHLFEVRYKVCS